MRVEEFFALNKRAAIAFSGGADSSYLLLAAVRAGADVTAYFVDSQFQPEFELRDAKRAADFAGAGLCVLKADVLSDPVVAANGEDRCYRCKKTILSCVAEAAARDGYSLICDGTNASDDASARPGMRAAEELGVCSPLRECGLTKADVRRLSEEAGLFTWNKPAYSCLATRIPSGVPITREDLERTERAEDFLSSLGFSDIRVRLFGGAARLQLPAEQLPALLERRDEITGRLLEDYSAVLLDLEGRKP